MRQNPEETNRDCMIAEKSLDLLGTSIWCNNGTGHYKSLRRMQFSWTSCSDVLGWINENLGRIAASYILRHADLQLRPVNEQPMSISKKISQTPRTTLMVREV